MTNLTNIVQIHQE